ncbi:metal-dependent hydrolase [Enterobacteriaceae endosymbiont of Donacia versicolorea]|uniref:metal-dependent hydrolase n=1 Tax=Enterobacteriaceae endosymbiont of Donacia versicolorea TaxID=2675788 RepID=UPI001449E050|nr:metal-dependent hydrolase [Enterobacteriaceae endosymbiont of Donacia versicolorea]QJC31904.1 metal-dependent hydrolase [Enterobacteriaceae endosymbiont of Donacia versicolorea]
MTIKGHIIFTIASSILVQHFIFSKIMYHDDWWRIIPISIITCLLPDIDNPKSIIGSKIKIFSYIINKIFGHRGFTHSLLSVISFGFIIFSINLHFNHMIYVKFGLIIGYLSHIIADILTPLGVPLLWPYKKKYKLPLITKNIIKEDLFCYLYLIFSLYLLYPVCNNFIIKFFVS